MKLMSALRNFIRPDSYEQADLIDVVFRKTVANQPEGDWAEIAGASTVLDFGGACGWHYKQARSHTVRWAVVETPAMVARASELASDKLRFFTSIEAATRWLGSIDVMHSNGALQYSPDPIKTLRQLCSVGARKMLWYRLALTTGETVREVQTSHLFENGPGTLPGIKDRLIKYPLTKIPERDFLDAHSRYRLVARGPDWFRFDAV